VPTDRTQPLYAAHTPPLTRDPTHFPSDAAHRAHLDRFVTGFVSETQYHGHTAACVPKSAPPGTAPTDENCRMGFPRPYKDKTFIGERPRPCLNAATGMPSSEPSTPSTSSATPPDGACVCACGCGKKCRRPTHNNSFQHYQFNLKYLDSFKTPSKSPQKSGTLQPTYIRRVHGAMPAPDFLRNSQTFSAPHSDDLHAPRQVPLRHRRCREVLASAWGFRRAASRRA
jgi:hypothetical protein